jgi:hypothetical protein
MIRNGPSDGIPKRLSMMEMEKVANLMHDDVLSEFRRKLKDTHGKIEVPFRRCTPPARPRVLDEYLLRSNPVLRGEPREKTVNNRACLFSFANIPRS